MHTPFPTPSCATSAGLPSASLRPATGGRTAGGEGPLGQQHGHSLFRLSNRDPPVESYLEEEFI